LLLCACADPVVSGYPNDMSVLCPLMIVIVLFCFVNLLLVSVSASGWWLGVCD